MQPNFVELLANHGIFRNNRLNVMSRECYKKQQENFYKDIFNIETLIYTFFQNYW